MVGKYSASSEKTLENKFPGDKDDVSTIICVALRPVWLNLPNTLDTNKYLFNNLHRPLTSFKKNMLKTECLT